jgi:hypothetical protein
MDTVFVAQTYGEVGSGDMWWCPWVVITIAQPADKNDVLKALRTVSTEDFADEATETVDWAKLQTLVDQALAAAGHQLVSVVQAAPIHFRA